MAAAVVGARFCTPRALRLTLTMNLTRGGTVTDDDASGAVVLRMEVPRFLRFFGRFVLADDDVAGGRPLVSVQRKAKAFSGLYGEWEAFRGDGHGGGELLFTAKKSTIVQVRTQMDIFLASNRAKEVCDFRIKCTFYEGSAEIYLGNSNTVIAQIRRHRTVLGKSRFSVTVFPNVDYVFIMALVVMLNEIHVERLK
ncbi:hypothetical protein BDA96_02G085300 [Sorghum bicolor]|uniref:Tubby C-terminal domain-containing protein n=1 Tax=Sorghum bicolor TaxID=4558 RepID=A0A921RNP4_SORBI|nr:hypothetical protein BDA96_02G085300 [Sorghum bicolor]